MYQSVPVGEEMPNPLRDSWEIVDEGGPICHVHYVDGRPFAHVRVSSDGTVRSAVVAGEFTEDGRKMSLEPKEGMPEFTLGDALATVQTLRRILCTD